MNLNFTELTSVFALESHNFKVLHWMAKGKQFDRIHSKLSSDYYEMVSEDMDTVAEYGMRLGQAAPSYVQVTQLLHETDCCEYEVIEGEDIDYDKFVEKTGNILKCIIDSLLSAYQNDYIQNDIRNVGIKSGLEAMIDKYDLQYRYLNERRKG